RADHRRAALGAGRVERAAGGRRHRHRGVRAAVRSVARPPARRHRGLKRPSMNLRHALFVVAALALAAAAAPAKADPVPWLKLGNETLAGWQATVDPGDANKLTLARAGAAAGAVSILVTIPWPSSAYDTAL